MVLLVVGNYQAVDFERVPWTHLTGVMWVHCRKDSYPDLKYHLKVKCREHSIPLEIQFAVPPLETVPTELLIGFGLRLSEEVILYDECITAFGSPTKNPVAETSPTVHQSA